MSFTRSESERLARLKGCTTGIYCRYGRPTGGITGPTGPAAYSFFTLGGNQGSLAPATGSIMVVNMSTPGQTGSVGYSNILQASQVGYTGSAPNPSPYLKVDSDIIPAKNNIYSIGSENMKFKSAYFGANTVYIDGVPIGSTGGTTIVMPTSVKIGQTLLTASGDTLVLPGTVRLGSMNGPILGATGPTGPGGSGSGADGGMEWINTNLLGAAPMIDISDIKIRSSEIFIGWNYPAQQQLTFVDVWVPAITTFSASLSYAAVGAQKDLAIADKQASQEYVDYKRAATKKPITGIVLTRVNTGNQYIENFIWHDGSSRAVYRYYHPDFEMLDPATEPVITLWYSNYSSTTTKGVATLNVFITAGPPSVPRNLAANSTTFSATTLSFNHPQFVDIDDPASTAVIKSYDILYSTAGSVHRYPGPLAQSLQTTTKAITNYNMGDTISQGLSSLYPDSEYEIAVRAKNSALQDGSAAIINVQMEPIDPPQRLVGLAIDPSQFYGGTIKRVRDEVAVSGLLLNVGPAGRIQTTQFTSPIQTRNTRGSTATGLMQISAAVKDATGNVLSQTHQAYDGFSDPIVVPGDAAAGGIVLRTMACTDANTAPEKQGFYLKATNQVFMDISGYIQPSPDPYSLAILHDISGGSPATATKQFYYDILPLSLGVSLVSCDILTGDFKRVSGIYIMGPSAQLKIITDLSGFNSYFYRVPFLEYTNSIDTIKSSEVSLSYITQGLSDNELYNNIRIHRDNTSGNSPIIVNNSNMVFSNKLEIQLKAYSIYTTITSDVSNIPVIIDVPTYRLITNPAKYPLTVQIFGVSQPEVQTKVGYRVLSGISRGEIGKTSNIYNTEFNASIDGTYIHDISYNNDINIIDTEELQIVNGKYRTKGTSALYYMNYDGYYNNNNSLDYSKIDPSGYRFATFKWGLNEMSDLTLTYSSLAFIINGISDIRLDELDGTVHAGSSKLLIYYRFVDIESNNPLYPTDYSSLTTSWVSANDRIPELSSGTYITPADNTYTLGGLIGSPAVDNINKRLTIISKLHTTFNKKVNLYVRIGLPMNINVAFENIEVAFNIL